MDLVRLIKELRAERDYLDQAIAALENLDGERPPSVRQGRRGRHSMSAEERQAVSERMQRYWANRKVSASNGSE